MAHIYLEPVEGERTKAEEKLLQKASFGEKIANKRLERGEGNDMIGFGTFKSDIEEETELMWVFLNVCL